MRLLLISSELPPGPGGIGNHAHQLALHLHRLDWTVVVVSPQDYAPPDQVKAFNLEQPFRIVPVPSGMGRVGGALHRLRTAWRVARELRPDIVMGSGLSGVWLAAMLGVILRVPAVGVAHGSEFGASSGLLGTLSRMAFARMRAVVAVSQFTRGVVERAGIRTRRLSVIPNAANPERFLVQTETERLAFRNAQGFGDAPLLVTVGQVSERKGQEVVIRALPAIAEHVPQVQYAMVGLPTLKDELTRLAWQLGVADRVHFAGSVVADEMVSWMNCADVFVMTSRTTSAGDCEGFGIAVVEAALCGKPAVVTSQSGLIEAIEEGITGLAVPENDPAATAHALVALLTDAPRRTAMGAAAERRARRDQTWDICARRYDVLLREQLCD